MLERLSPRKKLVLAALLGSLCISGLSLLDPGGLPRLRRLRSDIERQEQKNRIAQGETNEDAAWGTHGSCSGVQRIAAGRLTRRLM